jgi:hypothetical protein
MDVYWEENRDAMLWWMQRVLTGLGGMVVDARDNTPLDATIKLVGRDLPNTILTDPDAGDYHRVISPGSYTLEASATCYQSQSTEVSVVSGTVTVQDFNLDPMIDLSNSKKIASVNQANPEDIVNYQVRLENTCLSTVATITDTLPTQVTWTGYLTATQGIPIYDSGQILWQGEVAQSQPVTITYAVSLNQCLPAGMSIINLTELDDGVTGTITRTAQVEVTNAAPNLPSSPSPVDGSISQPNDPTLSWAPSTDLNCDPITYDLAFGTSPTPPIFVTELSDSNYNPGALIPDTTYYWYVIAHDGLTQTLGPTWSFTTIPLLIFLPITLR